MADKKVILEVEIIEGNAQSTLNELNTSLKSLDKTHKDYKPTLELIAKAERDLSKVQQKRILIEKGLTSSASNVDKATKKTAKQMKQLSSDTGASTSATLELGRVFSDAPYGIRGVANNIQQLASNLFFMSKKTNEATGKTIGFGGAVGSLLKNLIGPAGILVAFQAGIALLDYFKGGMSSAGSSASDFKESIEDLTKTIDELNLSQDEAISKTKEYIEFKVLSVRLNEEIADSTEKMADLDDDIADNKAYILKREKQLYGELTKAQYHALSEEEKIAVKKKAQGALTENSEEALAKKIRETSDLEKDRLDLYQSTSKLVEELRDNKDELTDADKDSLKGLKKLKRERIEEREVLSKNSQKYKELTIAIDDYQKKIEEIEGKKLKKSSKGKKISPFKTSKELELDVENNLSAIDKLQRRTDTQLLKNREKEELSLATTEQQKKQIKERYAIENLEIQIKYELKALDLKAKIEETGVVEKQKAYVKGLDDKLIAYEKSLRDEKGALSRASKEALSLATTETESLKKESKKELASTVSGIQEEYAKLFPFWVQFAEARRVALGVGGTEDGEDPVEKELEGVAFYVEQYTKLMSGIGDFLQAESDRELAIEQNKTNELNTELNNRLLNENLSKNQRQAIQNEIAQNDEKLRIKQNAIKKKAFNTQKAFNISLAIANTVSAGISAASATYGGPIAKIAAMTAVIGAGMAQVAVIARQRFQPDSANTPINTGSGGGGGSGRAEPSFNIVGRSNDNILLSAIQSQFDQPLRAYVVARDVTNQQQLDGVISTSAST